MVTVNFNMMIGLQGSGKSSFIQKETQRLGALWCYSADKLREQFPQENNEQIFDRYYKDLDDFLSLANPQPVPISFNVYLDNTHFQLKARKVFFSHLAAWKKKYANINFRVTAYVMATPFELCLQRVKQREQMTGRAIPEEVLYKYRASFNMPYHEEGFDEIKIIDGISLQEITSVVCDTSKYVGMMYKMIDFDQENPHHKYTLGEHMSVAQELVLLHRDEFNDFSNVYRAAAIHDWGKYYTKTYNAEGNGIYYNHSQVGTYELLTHLELIPQVGATMHDICRILTFVNYHMEPFGWNTEKALKKAQAKFGLSLVSDLCTFNRLDKEASGGN